MNLVLDDVYVPSNSSNPALRNWFSEPIRLVRYVRKNLDRLQSPFSLLPAASLSWRSAITTLSFTEDTRDLASRFDTYFAVCGCLAGAVQ